MLNFLLKRAARSAIWAVKKEYNRPERKGARGERQVHVALTSVLDEQEYKVLSDLILPVGGRTTQLDHLVLSRYGIFVIETKNMSGWVFGGADQKKWTQVHKGGHRRSFQNPLRQNYAHVKAIQGLLGVDIRILHSMIVFTGTAEPKTAMPDNVAWGLQALGRQIALRRKLVLSEDQVRDYVQKLQRNALENTTEVREAHNQNLKRKSTARGAVPASNSAVGAITAPCPRCGGKMVERTNRKTGDTFWGCVSFPKCKGTRSAHDEFAPDI